MVYKGRKRSLIFLIVFIYIMISLSGCKNTVPPVKTPIAHTNFSVNFLDVGQGDCIFIRLPDGKNMIIDCGVNDFYQENINLIMSFLREYSVNCIDFLILTHPDIDHIGNALSIINNFTINEIYIPSIRDDMLELFSEYDKILKLVNEKNIPNKISNYFCSIKGENYAFAFLSPVPKGLPDSSYDDLIMNQVPSDSDINNLSPIIYFECFGKRFLFTGDAQTKQEKVVINNYKVGIYNLIFSKDNISVSLENIDYLKLSHHGSEDASCEEFLQLTNPKNTIISVGNSNFYGHPSSKTLERLMSACPNTKILRTDRLGSISIYKKDNSEFNLSTYK